MKVKKSLVAATVSIPSKPAALFPDVCALIKTSRQRVSAVINKELNLLYWNVGKRINDELLGNERAEYGKRIIESLSCDLTEEFGRGRGEAQLWLCSKFASVFPERSILDTLCKELNWSQIRTLLPFEDALKRDFYIEMCKLERWSVRTLRGRIDSMLYERTAISKKPAQTIRNDLALLKKERKLTPDLVFRDPYFLDFLGLADSYSEKDLENTILAELQRFIIEFGSDFAFTARQKRIVVGGVDYCMDLLFYHRGLRRLIVIDLKLGDFKPEHKAQMEVYLRWLDKHDRRKGENKPLGLILCAGKKQELVELLELGKSGIHVAEYFTNLPSKGLLEQKLRDAVQSARSKLANTPL